MNHSEAKGIIFNIQKFSLNDGPGIRTVVFFKGCPLRCKWCANPESQTPNIQKILPSDPTDLSQIATMEGKEMSVSEIIKICLQDQDFYEESGGGVTLSGGECLMQPDFTLALLKELRNAGIHTAMETTGFTSSEVFQKISAYVDFFLFDMKHWNPQKHTEGTGVSNERILSNLKLAIASGKKILTRIPVIPGYNDSVTDAQGFCEILTSVGQKDVQLLPFHQFGEKKYEMLEKNYVYRETPALHEEDLQDYLSVFHQHHISAFF